ncbi:MAG: hypothetical protein A2583_06690 [Bdellovibrionales bacterium RIFOXYD1_FULL_53_11]|nr:MAG: hypothetical protein A2583_06690 [Bdellovibrionales bacterium RIFOXYD1_FULL_53_11]
MALLREAVEEKHFDTRVVERNVQRAMVEHDDVQKMLKNLPDDTENADWISIDEIAEMEDDSERRPDPVPVVAAKTDDYDAE